MVAKKKPAKKTKASTPNQLEPNKRYLQTEFPVLSLQETQKIALGLWDGYAGDSATPPDVALAIGISPTSSNWRVLCGSSIAYGLTAGGFNADKMALTPLGRKLVAPEAEGADLTARVEAILKPRIMREFFEKYRRAKFPPDIIAGNVLRSMGVPNDRIEASVEIVKANGKYAGIIRDTPTGPFANLDSPTVPPPAVTAAVVEPDTEGLVAVLAAAVDTPPATARTAPAIAEAVQTAAKSNRVFISHGKQKAVLNQLKELLAFGQLEPVVSVEREATAIPVPEKVFEDMRSCSAGVIHVSAEGQYTDAAGTTYPKINDNVLIEIGGAMALYGRRVILLVEKGVTLPSNLQGLYRCDYEGDKLDYDATMKLLKTFNQFR